MNASKVSTSCSTRLLGVSSSLISSPSNAVVFCLVIGNLLCCDSIHAGLYSNGVLIGHHRCDYVVEGEGGCFRLRPRLCFGLRLTVFHLERRNKIAIHVLSLRALSHSVVQHVL